MFLKRRKEQYQMTIASEQDIKELVNFCQLVLSQQSSFDMIINLD